MFEALNPLPGRDFAPLLRYDLRRAATRRIRAGHGPIMPNAVLIPAAMAPVENNSARKKQSAVIPSPSAVTGRSRLASPATASTHIVADIGTSIGRTRRPGDVDWATSASLRLLTCGMVFLHR